MSEIEKRAARRKAVALRIKLRYEGVETFIAKFATNVSRAGLFIRSKSPKEAGTIVRFELLLADGSSVVKGAGEVKWTREFDPQRPRAHFGMGIAFTQLDSDSRKMIERIVRHRAAKEGDFEPEKIPHRTPTADPVPPPRPAPLADRGGSADRTRPTLPPEPKKRPRVTLEEVMARAVPAEGDPSAPLAGLDDDVSVASALKRARQITEIGETDELLDELESGSAVPQATAREASQKLAALFGDLPVRRRRVAKPPDLGAAATAEPTRPTEPGPPSPAIPEPTPGPPPPEPDPVPVGDPDPGGEPISDPAPEPAPISEPTPISEPEPSPPPVSEPTPISEPEPDPPPISEPTPISEPEPAPGPTPTESQAASPASLFRSTDDLISMDLDEPATLPVSLDDALSHLDPELELELEGDAGLDTSVDGDPLSAQDPDFGAGSFSDPVFDVRTVARPDLAAALADAGEVIAGKKPTTSPGMSSDRYARPDMQPSAADTVPFAKQGGDPAADHHAETRRASVFGNATSEPELDEDIEAALDALIPDDLFATRPDSMGEGSDLGIGDQLGFHRLPSRDDGADGVEDDEIVSDDELFPPIGESSTAIPMIPEGDYVISFQPDPLDSDSPEHDATFARAQAAMEELEPRLPSAEIDLSDHLELDAPGAEAAPTFITDMPSAALASDLATDLDNEIAAGRSLDALLEPEEPFPSTTSDGPVHGIGDFFDPQPLSEEVPIEVIADLSPPLAVPPPIPQPPPIPPATPHVSVKARPPDTLPNLDLGGEPQVLGPRVKAPGLPDMPEEDIDIDVSMDEFDQSPAVVTGAPIPIAVTDEEPVADEPKKKGLFNRLFKKS